MKVDDLTDRENEVLGLMARGYSTTDISSALFITRDAVRGHKKRIYGKLGVGGEGAAARAVVWWNDRQAAEAPTAAATMPATGLSRNHRDRVPPISPTLPTPNLHAPSRAERTRALAAYYPLSKLTPANLSPYCLSVDGREVGTDVVTKRDWLDLAIPLDATHDNPRFVRDISPSLPESGAPIERLRRLAQAKMGRAEDGPVYRLTDVELSRHRLQATYGLSRYFEFRYGPGLMAEELDEQITQHGAHGRHVLPLRDAVVPDGAGLLAFRNRIASGGISVLLAVIEGSAPREFQLYVQRRSPEVFDAQNMLCVVPSAFHHPLVEGRPAMEAPLSSSVYRELYEELLGGVEVERSSDHVKWDWWMDLPRAAPVRWLRDHPESRVMDVVSLGVKLAPAQFDFGILLAIHDPFFWDRFGADFRHNWEVASVAHVVSSRDGAEIKRLISDESWAGEGLVAFVEGIRALGRRFAQQTADITEVAQLLRWPSDFPGDDPSAPTQ